MECNQEAALRAKELAEKKFEEKDIAGAKKFAIKAQNLNPELDGIPQLITTLDVYISAEKRTNEDVDWYRVLGVDPLADVPTIRNHFKELALVIHPSKNKSVGADGAFRILYEAWRLLSDKDRRNLYDQKRNLRCTSENVLDQRTSVSNGQNGFHNLSHGNGSLQQGYKGATYSGSSPTSPCPLKPSFWTVCNACKTYFEYLRIHLNHRVSCSNCHQPFYAIEIPTPPINFNDISSELTIKKSSPPSEKRPASTTNVGLASFSDESSKKTSQACFYSKVGNVDRTRTMDSISAQGAGGIHSKIGKWKRKCEDTVLDSKEVSKSSSVLNDASGKLNTKPSIVGLNTGSSGVGLNTGSSGVGLNIVSKEDRPHKKRKNEQKMEISVGAGNGVASVDTILGSKVSVGTRRLNVPGNGKTNRTRELSLIEMRNVLQEKAKKVISEKLNEWRMEAALKVQNQSKEVREKEKGKKEVNKPVVKADMSKCGEHVDCKKEEHTAMTCLVKSNVSSKTNSLPPVSMSVVDPDFYDFDKNRTERSFGNNQVWAAYDEDDGMPRYYAMVHRLISTEPFKMRISWLTSKGNDELAPVNWVASGFPKTSGDFRSRKHEVYSSLNCFSHQVKWTKGTRGGIQIYPTKGDVWALYKNWSPDWNALTPDEIVHKYEMMEVLEDYNEERGATVVPLVKVAGFKTVFRRHWDPSKIRTIPREQMFRFSHQVPSYLLTGSEGQNAPKDCWELDPASTPLELLQVTSESLKDDTEETSEKNNGGKLVESFECPKVQELMEDGKTNFEKGLVLDSDKEVAAGVTKREEKETKGGQLKVYKRRCRR
ncbi:uncharacterized protein LOC133830049 [Humulus lupulus]|uniref:uncharacterized protein LOC133830049 n=1 Tax=Humulus lupulus TaxID=3486 RepID=UPI002B414D34|nr:uncharacterized protein LOC133830049 [Humulus lupulus]